jgi:hypothetical protein
MKEYIKENFQNEYLAKKLEPGLSHEEEFSDDKRQKRLDKSNTLNRDIFEHEYNEGDGKIEFTKGDTKVFLEYSKPDSEEWNNLMLRNGYEYNDWGRPSYKYLKVIEKFIIENSDDRFDSSELLTNSDYKMYFQSRMIDYESDKSRIGYGFILSDHDILTPKGLLMLFHEIGHYKISKQYGSKYEKVMEKIRDKLSKKDTFFTKAKEKDGENILREERNAWASALNDLKPFLEDLEIEFNEAE